MPRRSPCSRQAEKHALQQICGGQHHPLAHGQKVKMLIC